MSETAQIASGQAAIAAMFERTKREGRAAFLPFAMMGYPTLAESMEAVERMSALGADGFEIGVPFSDPLADGPVIQQASQVALENGVTVQTGLDAIRQLRERGVKQPMLFFCYINPLLAYGAEAFAQALQEAGADGLICPDLPPEEAHLFEAVTRRGLALVFFAAPTSNEGRIKLVAQRATGFVYVVSVTGTTGARRELPPDLAAYAERLRQHIDLPLVMGFGISTPAQAAQVSQVMDGFIVASALIKIAPQGVDAVAQLAGEIRAAL
jgi:tryptophan synthase alpha chain